MSEQPTAETPKPGKPRRNNMAVLVSCLLFVGVMVGAAYAAVPFYYLFCRVTGFNGTVKQVEQASDRILSDRIRVEFDTNVASDLNWEFKPLQEFVNPRLGETVQVSFRLTNHSTREKTARSVFNVTPLSAGPYLNKLECFCFSDITLKPGESRDMPVVFFVDPDMKTAPETLGMKVLTLSYTLYGREVQKPVADANATDASVAKKL